MYKVEHVSCHSFLLYFLLSLHWAIHWWHFRMGGRSRRTLRTHHASCLDKKRVFKWSLHHALWGNRLQFILKVTLHISACLKSIMDVSCSSLFFSSFLLHFGTTSTDCFGVRWAYDDFWEPHHQKYPTATRWMTDEIKVGFSLWSLKSEVRSDLRELFLYEW